MKGLTDRQEEVLKFISHYLADHEYPPSYQEIADHFGIASKHGVVRHLEALEKKGCIKRDGTTARGMRIIDERYLPLSESMDIPLIGQVQAGLPVFAAENIEEQVTVPRSLIRAEGRYFALRVKGDSMINAGIMEDDLVVVESTETAAPKQIVVAVIGEEVTVKRLIVRDGKKVLKAENPNYPDIEPDVEWRIQGRVTGLIRNMGN